MRLLLYPVTLILLVAISNATPPPGYVKPPNDDKDPPRYEYKYEIDNADEKGSQGKTESRSGDLASGRYYVNGEKSLTDVKYYADEWGYHPLVKYRIANDHSVATTHFASGEHIVKALLLNGTEVGEELPALRGLQDQPHGRPPYRHRPVQLVQPHTPGSEKITVNYTNEDVASSGALETQSNDYSSGVNLPQNYNDQRMLAQASSLRQPASSTSSFQRSFHNYVTLPQAEFVEQYKLSGGNERDYHAREDQPVSGVATTPVPDHRTFEPTSINVGHSSTTSSLSDSKSSARDEDHSRGQEGANDLSSTLSDDVLIVENAGSFGRRIKPTLATHQDLTENKTRGDIASSTLPASYEITTSKSILRISDKATRHGVSSYTSTNVPTARPINALGPNNVERPMIAPTSEIEEVNNSVGPKVSSTNYRYPMSGIGYREDSTSDSYAGIFAKIFPNAVRDHEIGESVNSLIASDWQLSDQAVDENNTILIHEAERMSKPGLLNYEKSVDHQLYVTLRQSLESEIRDSSNERSSTPATLSTYSSKPIVVAELTSNETGKGPGYSTAFPCDDEETSTLVPSASSAYPSSIRQDSGALLMTPKLQVYQGPITTSSVVLNPIQAGVRLVNADQAESIGAESPKGKSPAPVTENIEGDSQASAVNHFSTGWGNELGKIVAEETRSKLYETINPAFGQPMLESESIAIDETASNSARNAPTLDGNQEDQQIEIQKSVEIYQNAPVREIHYLPQVITQVSGINHNREQGVNQQREKNIGEVVHERDGTKEAEEMSGSYVELQDAGNPKQLHGPPQAYNREEEATRESHGTQLSLGNIRDSSLIGGSVYHGNLVRQDNELADYPIERNNGLPTLLPGDEDAPRIIQLIRDGIPEVKYIAAKAPRINVRVYPTGIQAIDNGTSGEWQQNVAHYKTAEQSEKVLSPLQKILSESDGVQRYFSASEWSEAEDQVTQHQHHSAQDSPEEQESYQVQENVDESRVRQPEEQPSRVLPWAQLYTGLRNHPGSSNDAIQAVSNMSQTGLSSHHSPLAGDRIVEKTVHVPQPYPVEVPRIIEKKVIYPVEKIIERQVPYPVEKIIEKKVPYPIHIQVPVDRVIEKQVQILQPYPVHIEKIIEKKVPYPVQRLVPQPYPVHILQPYPVEKIIEKPVHVPVTIEKIVEKKVHIPQPYPVQVPVKLPYPVELMKYIDNTVQVPYGVRYGVSYQQIMKPQSSKGLYGGQSTVSVPLYGVSLVSNHNRDRGRSNATQDFQGYNYDKPAIPFVSGAAASSNGDHQRSNGWENFSHDKPSLGLDNIQRHSTFGKKVHHGYTSKLPSFAHPIYNYSGTNRRHAFYRQSDDKSVGKDEYIGPVPSLKANSQLKAIRSRSSVEQQQLPHKQQHSTAVTRPASAPTLSTSSRRARQQDNSPHYQTGPGAFRQSKIEYGFKPPMVPSVQYDEKTATKLDN